MRIRLLSAAALLAFAAAPAFAAPVTYKIDPTHTIVLAQWNHFGFSNPSASFGNVEGTLVYDAADVARSSVEVTLPLSGLEGFSAKFNEHLRSADFFDAAKFPKATFKSTKVEAAGEGKLKVTGDLTIKDVTKPVTIEFEQTGSAVDPFGNTRVGFEGEVTIDRTEWNLSFNAALETGGVLVSEKVKLEFDISAIAAVPTEA